MNYNEKLDELFDLWEKESIADGLNGFCKDGLMFKGEIVSEIGSDGKRYWSRGRNDESKLWADSKRRILFLMKDTNGNPGNDSREWLGRQHPTTITHRFFKTISILLYGIYNTSNEGIYPDYKEAGISENFSKAFDDIPFSIVNCKKEAGVGSITDKVLWDYCMKYGKYLKQQIEILKPNIIICGGGTYKVVFDIAKQIIYPELSFVEVNSRVSYNKENDITLIHSMHPSARVPYDRIYLEVLDYYAEFLKKKL